MSYATNLSPIILSCIIGVVAVLYASVGHGGASGYLATMSLLAYDPDRMSTIALILNLGVAGVACVAFARAGFGSWRAACPWIACSIPAAFLGGQLAVPMQIYAGLLSCALMFAAVRLTWPRLWTAVSVAEETTTGMANPPAAVIIPVASSLGLVSGVVGVGGGIFLSPLLLIRQWASPKHVAAMSALFILANSTAGLLGRALTGRFAVDMWWLLPAALVGGSVGSWLGARHLSNRWLCRLMSLVLLVAAVKLMMMT